MIMIMGKRILRIIESVNTRSFKIDETVSTMTIADTTLTALLLLAAKKKRATRNTPINTGTLNITVNMIIYLLIFLLFFFNFFTLYHKKMINVNTQKKINGDYHCLESRLLIYRSLIFACIFKNVVQLALAFGLIFNCDNSLVRLVSVFLRSHTAYAFSDSLSEDISFLPMLMLVLNF